MTASRSPFARVLRVLVSTSVLAAMDAAYGKEPQSTIEAAHMAANASSTSGHAVTAGAVANGTSEAGNLVAIRNFSFQPAILTVAAGSKVVWMNRDEEPHVVVSNTARFPASPALDTDDSYALVFATPGTYSYFCAIHPHMAGMIVVQ